MLRAMARRDVRPLIYFALDELCVAGYAYVLAAMIPNRLPSAAIHLWALPVAMQVMAAGTLAVAWPRARRAGRRVALVAGTVVLALVIGVIVRVLVSAAFLAGVYGAFGRAAATAALIAIALIVELCALLPVVQVKYLMSRAGRAAYA